MGHAVITYYDDAFPSLRHTCAMPATHSDGVSRQRFVTRQAEQ